MATLDVDMGARLLSSCIENVPPLCWRRPSTCHGHDVSTRSAQLHSCPFRSTRGTHQTRNSMLTCWSIIVSSGRMQNDPACARSLALYSILVHLHRFCDKMSADLVQEQTINAVGFAPFPSVKPSLPQHRLHIPYTNTISHDDQPRRPHHHLPHSICREQHHEHLYRQL